MGGWIGTGVSVLACVALFGTDHRMIFWSAVAAAVLNFWSHGIMHNFAQNAARAEGRRHVEPRDTEAVPDWLAGVNMIATLAGFGLLLAGLVIRFA